MKIKVTRSRWPWGTPNVRVAINEEEGMIWVEGAYTNVITADDRKTVSIKPFPIE